MVIHSSLCIEIFNESIHEYHIADNVDQPMPGKYETGDIRYLLFKKNWIDTVQWHLEDIIRDPSIDPQNALSIKRRIDQSNQDRTDIVELLDHVFSDELKDIPAAQGASVNTETPAWAIDRLSILSLKIYHMKEASERNDASPQHRIDCSAKLTILLRQQSDLAIAIDQLLTDLRSGKKILKLYKQMKMYNDPSLNPILYKS